MAWTTFAALTNPTLPQLDGNFLALTGLAPIPCTGTVATNVLVLTQIAGAATVASYANYQRFTSIATGTNSGAVTANINNLGSLSVFKDTTSGPVALTGAEIHAGNEFTLVYDLALSGGTGGFHLKT